MIPAATSPAILNRRFLTTAANVPTLAAVLSTMKNQRKVQPETLAQVYSRLTLEAQAAYSASPFSAMSRDYFARFSRDPRAEPDTRETAITAAWTIAVVADEHPVVRRLAGHLAEFLQQCMAVRVPVREVPALGPDGLPGTIALYGNAGGDPAVPESFTLHIARDRIVLRGRDPAGVRDGIVRMVNGMGLRQAPFLDIREQVYRPRLAARIGTIPWMGSCRDLVLMGFNTLLLPGGSLFELSTSDAIPTLAQRRNPEAMARAQAAAAEAAQYGLKTYCWVNTVRKFPGNDPVFQQHPGIRGPRTWKQDGEYILCTEHPLVRRWLAESAAGLFRAIPGLWGMGVIIGGEGFYHCFMHPHGAPNGHTTCPRCEALGPDTVVANLCNGMARAARVVNPEACITAWPYSAEHCWAGAGELPKMIGKLEAGTAIVTEIEKEQVVEKPYGLSKLAWDYSIDAIGPCRRARAQIDLCRQHGIPVLMKSEPELAFEASRLAGVPCMDRWFARAEALAACGATGAIVVPAFRNLYATVVSEIGQWKWWDPCRNDETLLALLAERVAGAEAGPALRRAWRMVSEAIAWSPEIPGYYHGPHYLGPAHPMCADPAAEVPRVFFGQYLFHAEITDAEGLKSEPTFWRDVANGVPLLQCYVKMDELLTAAVREIGRTARKVPERCRMVYAAETSQVRWFHHTVRTEVNFYRSCLLRGRIMALAAQSGRTAQAVEEGMRLCDEWRGVLRDEQRNTQRAMPVARADMRLDFYYGSDHTFPHLLDMLRAKRRMIRREIEEFLPSVEQRIRGVGQGPEVLPSSEG